jgi:hypothetical protein
MYLVYKRSESTCTCKVTEARFLVHLRHDTVLNIDPYQEKGNDDRAEMTLKILYPQLGPVLPTPSSSFWPGVESINCTSSTLWRRVEPCPQRKGST